MEKHRSATYLVALALVGSFVAISVEAQGSIWQSKGAPPAQAPQHEQGPQSVQPPPPKAVPRPQEPQIAPQPPQFPGFPPIRVPQTYSVPQVQPPPKMPQHHNVPQVQPPPKMPQHHNVPQVQPPPKIPQHHNVPQVQPPPKMPQHHNVPQVQPPPKIPQRHNVPQVQPPPKIPQHHNVPQVQPPPKIPQHHKVPQVQPPPKTQPGPPPVYPARPQDPYVPPPKHPNTPQTQPGPPPIYPVRPQDPYVPPPKHPNLPQTQPGPPPVYPVRLQDPYVPPPKHHNPPQTQPGPPPVYPVRPQDPYVPPPKHHNPPQTQPGPPPVYPVRPQDPYVPPPKHHNPPQTQPGPPPVYPVRPQDPYVPPPKHHNPPQTQPGPPPVYPVRPQDPYVPPPKYHNPPQTQPGPPPVYPVRPQDPYVPPPKHPNTPQTQPGPPRFISSPFPARQPKPHQPSKFTSLFPRSFSNFESPQEPHEPQPQKPHQPTSPQELTIRHQPKQPSFQSCEVEQNVRVPCGAPDISAAACEAISCCFDGRQCYFGKAVTVQCTKDAQFIVVVARDATLPHIDLSSISLLGEGQGCTHVDSNSEFAIYQFPVTACGSVVMEEPGVIIYENRMSSSFEVGVGDLGVITRDSYYDLLFQCRYIGSSVETVVTEVLPLQEPPLGVAAWGPIEVQLRLANGQCHTKGCNELDVAYTSFYTEADYPVTKVLRDPVYVEVQLMGKTDPHLVLTLGRCWTTTSSNPHSLPQWDILIDGCPYRDDRYMSSLVPVGSSSGLDFPSHYRRFLFKMFTFVDSSSMVPLREQVYIHCSAAVCTAALGGNCEPSCFRNKRDVHAVEQRKADPKVVVTVGPVNMSSPQQ